MEVKSIGGGGGGGIYTNPDERAQKQLPLEVRKAIPAVSSDLSMGGCYEGERASDAPF